MVYPLKNTFETLRVVFLRVLLWNTENEWFGGEIQEVKCIFLKKICGNVKDVLCQ